MSKQPDFPYPGEPENPTYRGFFEGLQKQVLRARQCCYCGQWQWPPQEFCSHCQATEFVWRDLPQQGTVYSYTVMYRAFRDYYADKLPYGVVIVAVGQVHMSGRFIGDPADIACDKPVEAVWDELATKGTSPAWQVI